MKKVNVAATMTAALCMLALTACGAAQSAGSSAAADTTVAQSTEAGTEGAESSAMAESAGKSDAGSVADSVKSDGKFVVGFDQEFPPMGFVGDDGQYTGFDLDLAAETAKRLGLEFVPQPINWDAKDMELESGNIDCIWNGFTMQGREDAYSWVGPYMANKQVFVVDAASDIQTLADLQGKAVEVQKDSSGLSALSDESNKALKDGFSSLVEVADYNTALMDLESGACDAVCMDEIVAAYQIKSSGKSFRILDESLSDEAYGIGFKKGNEALAEQVKDTLLKMQEDGTLAGISEKWFGKDITTLGR